VALDLTKRFFFWLAIIISVKVIRVSIVPLFNNQENLEQVFPISKFSPESDDISNREPIKKCALYKIFPLFQNKVVHLHYRQRQVGCAPVMNGWMDGCAPQLLLLSRLPL
jgi:hypothetical protein